jgi:hypothetical protein
MPTLVATANISPMYVGDTKPNLQLTVTDDAGAAFDITGATFTLKLQLTTNTATVKTGAGSWTIDNGAGGLAHYVWNSADTNTPGEWYVWVNMAFAGSNQHIDPLLLEILSAPQ